MLDKNQIDKIKEAVAEFFEKMTMPASSIEASPSLEEKNSGDVQAQAEEIKDIVNLDVKIDEPQILIGQQGQTLFEIQRLLRTILNKKVGKIFYFNLDIDDYKKKKVGYLKDLAKELADQVSITKEEKVLLPMSAYERRIIHAELAKRADIATESQGEGFERHIVIRAK